MANFKEIGQYVAEAEAVAKQYGGMLPSMTELVDQKHHRIVAAIQRDRRPFEHLLEKDARGRDKEKYAHVAANLDVDNADLARDLGVSTTTVRKWKEQVRDENAGVDRHTPPRNATIDELALFASRNLPDEWRLNLAFDANGCYVTVVSPDGKIRMDPHAEGLPIAHSAMNHVNRARKKEGLDPVGWGRLS